MTKRIQAISPIQQAMWETAVDMHEGGLISARRLKEHFKFTHPSADDYPASRIVAIRKRTRASQTVFALALNVSPSIVQQWENGTKKPGGPSLRLLSIVERDGLEILQNL